jgi:hypothetical protein
VFHGLIFTYSIVALVLGNVRPSWKKYHYSVILVIAVILIAKLANLAYSTTGHTYDWAFIEGRNFPVFPENLNWLMPFAVFIAFSGSSAFIYFVYLLFQKRVHAMMNNKQMVHP